MAAMRQHEYLMRYRNASGRQPDRIIGYSKYRENNGFFINLFGRIDASTGEEMLCHAKGGYFKNATLR